MTERVGAIIILYDFSAPQLCVSTIPKLMARQNPTKIIASLISVIKIVKYFGIVGGGAKILRNDTGAPLFLSLR